MIPIGGQVNSFQEVSEHFFFFEGILGLRANAGAYTNNLETDRLPKLSGLKPMKPLDIFLNYSLVPRNKSFCLSLQGPLILAIHAILFPSSLSGIFTQIGGKQILGRIIPSPGDRVRLDPDGRGRAASINSGVSIQCRPGSKDRHSLCGADSRDKLLPVPGRCHQLSLLGVGNPPVSSQPSMRSQEGGWAEG